MLLNLMRVEGISPEWVLARSFWAFQRRGAGERLAAGKSMPFILFYFILFTQIHARRVL